MRRKVLYKYRYCVHLVSLFRIMNRLKIGTHSTRGEVMAGLAKGGAGPEKSDWELAEEALQWGYYRAEAEKMSNFSGFPPGSRG